MNVETNSTAPAGPATATVRRPYLGNAHDQAKMTLHLARAATLLMRHLLLDKAKDEAITCSQEHAETIEALMDLAWGRAGNTMEEIEAVWGRTAQ